ncbi:tyrosine-type recombinase/integrase [Colwellia sp. BRX10-3]|uniref:tyrosine-type recombinase/integrase n=1 Tax=Colwellia sp. BRX10-3 TaxID=2759844 RepID=UPI0015F4CC15|nr:site-specific integrase [Colwellia sp. BRX10-3]MBA6390459.1 tyrosine-type recombinase/integrase [Colwellia sp. BRX10-3]
MRIDKKQDIESLIRQNKGTLAKKCQYDVLVCVEDIPRRTGSLYLNINPTGAMSFRLLQRYKGKREFTVLGQYSPDNSIGLTLAKAREKMRELAKIIHSLNGEKSLKQHQKEQRLLKEIEQQSMQRKGTVEELIDDYTNHMKLEGKRSFNQVKHELLANMKSFLSVEAAKITSNDVCKVLGWLIQRGAEVQSNRVRSYIMSAMNFGIKYDHDPRYLHRGKKYNIDRNPVASIPRQSSAEQARDRVLSTEEVATLLHNLSDNHFSNQVEHFIKILLLTGGQRPYELSVAKWSDIDFDNRVWTIQSSVSKNKKIHLVPLVESAIIQLKELLVLNGEGKLLFPQRYNLDEPMPTSTLAQAIRNYCKQKSVNQFQPKDFRRTIKTKMGELGVEKSVRDRLQNHALQDVSSRHYDRYDYQKEKLSALITWEKWLLNLNKID